MEPSVNTKNSSGQTPAQIAIESYSSQVVNDDYQASCIHDVYELFVNNDPRSPDEVEGVVLGDGCKMSRKFWYFLYIILI